MNFAIEVPGEANPLNAQDLCKALQAGTSTDHNQRQSASQQLTEWEAHDHYFSLLQTVFLDKSLPHDIRFLAIILLKNGIDKYWRLAQSKTIKGIQPAEKQLIRSRLLQGSVDEEERSLALHNALVTAKITRIDYPGDWPEAVASIITVVRGVRDINQAQLSGALVVLLRVVKELSSAKLRRSQTALQAASPELFYLVAEIYAQKIPVWLEFLTKGRGDEDDADYAMQNSLTCLRILRRLLVTGYNAPHEDKLVVEFWSLSQAQFGQFLEHVSHDSIIPAPYQDVVGKHLLQFTKLHLEMSESHPASFALLPNSLSLVRAYWDLVAKFAEVFDKSGGIRQSAADGLGAKSKVEGPLLERLALQGLLLLKSCVVVAFYPNHTFKYRSKEAKKLEEQAVGIIKSQLLTAEFVLQIVNVVITKLFIFRKSDLDAWEEAPEEWEAQERSLGDAWQWQVRPCAERVFVDLLIHYRDLLAPPLLSYFQTAMGADAEIVTKEAVYTAMGSAVNTVYDAFDFDAFLASTLVKDAQIQAPLAKLLRRRIAILLSQWVPVKIADASRPLVFEVFRHLMNKNDPHNDEVVRITAARQMKYVADDFEFKAAAFEPFAADTFSQLAELLGEVEVDETKLAVLGTLRAFVDRMEQRISQFSDQIIAVLPGLWGSASEDIMIKQSILGIISTLVMSLRADSRRYHANIMPLVAEAMDPSSQVHQFLLEDAVDVWKSVMTQAQPPVSQDVTNLGPLALPLLDFDPKLAAPALEVVRAYIILAPEAVLADGFRRPVLAALAKSTESSSRHQVHTASSIIQHIIRAAEELGGVSGVSVVLQDMLDAGFLRFVLEALHERWQAMQTTGPRASKSKLNSLTEVDFFSILARFGLADPNLLVGLLSSVSGDVASVWKWLSQEWFTCLDNMSNVEQQKLSCLALTRLCEIAEPQVQELVLGRLQEYFSMWTTMVAEVQGGNAAAPDTLVWEGDDAPLEWETMLDVAWKAVASRDPIHREHAFAFIMLRLEDLIRRVGGEQAFEANWAVNVDKELLAAFRRLSQPSAGK